MDRARLFVSLALSMGLSSCAKDVGGSAGPLPSAEAGRVESPAAGRLPDRDIPLAKRLITEERAVVLDVRSIEEWNSAHYEGALLIHHTEIKARLSEVVRAVDGDRHRPLVLYCRSGRRADLARAALESEGFTRVTNAGGLVDLCPDCAR